MERHDHLLCFLEISTWHIEEENIQKRIKDISIYNCILLLLSRTKDRKLVEERHDNPCPEKDI